MNLYLVQHAEAKSKKDNPDRPLTDKGFDDIKQISEYLARIQGIAIDSILHSGKLRTLQTAEILSEYLRPNNGIEAVDDLDPTAEPAVWMDRLNQATGNIIMVGHLPYLSRLASRLLCGDEDREIIAFQNAGVVSLSRNDSGDWSIRWMVIPSIIVHS